MRAVILAAGRGTRMGTLTQTVPKPMLPVRGRPVLEHILQGLIQAGIREVVIVTGYRAEVIEEYFKDGRDLELQIAYARQDERPGTGAAAAAARLLCADQPFLLAYGDILVNPKVYTLVRARFEERKPVAVMTVVEGEDVRKGALVWFDDEMHVLGLIEKPTPGEIEQLMLEGHIPGQGPFWYNAGIYAFDPVVFEYLDRISPSPRGEYELTDAIGFMLEDGLDVIAEPIEGRWVDVRDPETLQRLNREGAA